jgi:hypothetical protein
MIALVAVATAGFLASELRLLPAGAAPVANTEANVITDCGAVPDGVTNNFTALQNCITQANLTGKSLYFPPGTYNVAGTLQVTNDSFSMRGANRETTSIVETTANADLLLVWKGSTAPLNQFTLRNIRLSYSSTSATGTALTCLVCWRMFIEDVNFGTVDGQTKGGGTSLKVSGYNGAFGNQVHVLSTNFSTPVSRAMFVAQTGDLFLQDVEVNLNDNNNSQLGIVLDSDVGGAYATNVNVTGGYRGFVFQKTLGGNPPNFVFLTNVLADTQNGAGGVGIELNSATSVVMSNSWAASAMTHGIVANGVDGLTIDSSRIYNNGGIGVVVGSGALNVNITNSRFAGNSRVTPGSSQAILLNSGANKVMIQNNRIGQQDTFSNTQAYAITVWSGYGDTLQINNNNFRGNVSGGLQNLATVGAFWNTTNNIG